MELNIPQPQQTGGGGSYWRRTEDKHRLRLFAFENDGDMHLALRLVVHFVDGRPDACQGPGCSICKEARETDNRRLRAVERFQCCIVDTDADENSIQTYDAPTTVYQAILDILEDTEAEDLLGNEGMDLIMKYDGSKPASSQYSVTVRMKGSKTLSIDDSKVPNLMSGGSAPVDADDDDEDDDTEKIIFIDAKGNECTGTLTGKKQKGKHLVEYKSRVVRVDPEDIVMCDSLGIAPEDEDEDEAAEPDELDEALAPEEDEGFNKGDKVSFWSDEDDCDYEGEVVSVNRAKETANVKVGKKTHRGLSWDDLSIEDED